MLGKSWKFCIDLELDSCGHKSKAFQKAFNVGVGAIDAIHAETPCDLRKFFRKLAPHLTYMVKFLVVIFKQPGVQGDRSVFALGDRDGAGLQVNVRAQQEADR